MSTSETKDREARETGVCVGGRHVESLGVAQLQSIFFLLISKEIWVM